MSNLKSTQPLARIQQYRRDLSRQLAGVPDSSVHGNIPQLAEDYLDYLETSLFSSFRSTNVGQIQEMLLELSCLIKGHDRMSESEYRHFLGRLVAIYARGVAQGRVDALTRTAADYADLIEASSQSYPEYDYTEALGQLLCYMGQLYRTGRSSWAVVYEHIASMPESVEAVQHLNKAFLSEVRQWADEGVANLFKIRRDTQQRISELEASVMLQTLAISRIEQQLPVDFPSDKIVLFSDLLKKREISAIQDNRSDTLSEIETAREILALIQENIEEFDDKLKNLRLSYNIRPIHNSVE